MPGKERNVDDLKETHQNAVEVLSIKEAKQ